MVGGGKRVTIIANIILLPGYVCLLMLVAISHQRCAGASLGRPK